MAQNPSVPAASFRGYAAQNPQKFGDPSTIISKGDALMQIAISYANQIGSIAGGLQVPVINPVFPTIARNLVRYLRMGISEGWLPRACAAAREGQKKSEPVEGSRPVTGSNATPLSEE